MKNLISIAIALLIFTTSTRAYLIEEKEVFCHNNHSSLNIWTEAKQLVASSLKSIIKNNDELKSKWNTKTFCVNIVDQYDIGATDDTLSANVGWSGADELNVSIGFLLAMNSEDQLLGVFAHELAHWYYEDIQQTYPRMVREHKDFHKFEEQLNTNSNQFPEIDSEINDFKNEVFTINRSNRERRWEIDHEVNTQLEWLVLAHSEKEINDKDLKRILESWNFDEELPEAVYSAYLNKAQALKTLKKIVHDIGHSVHYLSYGIELEADLKAMEYVYNTSPSAYKASQFILFSDYRTQRECLFFGFKKYPNRKITSKWEHHPHPCYRSKAMKKYFFELGGKKDQERKFNSSYKKPIEEYVKKELPQMVDSFDKIRIKK